MPSACKTALSLGALDIKSGCKEYVLDYLEHSFPVQLYEPFTDSEGNLSSRPIYRDGQPVECRDAVMRRGRMIERLAALPAVPGALDQIIHHFGTDVVAEVTGRGRRIVRRTGSDGIDRFVVEGFTFDQVMSDAEAMEAFVRKAAIGVWHASCSCRMGQPEDPMAVVDTQGRVKGIQGLRVVDASIFPVVPCANTNFPTLMTAEKIAEAMMQ